MIRRRRQPSAAMAREVDRLQAENHRLRQRAAELERVRARLLRQLAGGSPANQREVPYVVEAPVATEEELSDPPVAGV